MKLPERSLYAVPRLLWGLLLSSLVLQIIWSSYLPPPQAKIEELAPPPRIEVLRVLSLGDRVASAKILMLWLQSFDNQKGQFLSYQQLNYTTLQQWLEQILLLDSRTQYPLLSAVHLYANIPDALKRKEMLNFTYEQFFLDPSRRWPWLAHATVLAKHRLKDLPLALKYAKAITDHATPEMPRWAQEMQIFILEEMGELEQARLIIGGMLASGQLEDPNEVKFLNERLQELEQKLVKENPLLKK